MAVAALASFALVPAAAEAGESRSKVLRGSFTLVGSDGDYVTGKFGKVQLVDGRRNDKLIVHVRRLARRTSYTFALQRGSCGGTKVDGWRYRTLKTSRSGVGNSWARSRTFTVAANAGYYVAVYGPDGQMVVCARLSTKGKAQPQKSRGRDDDKARGKDKTRGKRDAAPRRSGDKTRGKRPAPRRSEDKTRGKSRDAPGQAQDKTRPNSQDAPGQDDDKTRGNSQDAPGHAEDKTRGKSQDAPGQAEDKTRGKSDDAPRGQGRDKGKKLRRR